MRYFHESCSSSKAPKYLICSLFFSYICHYFHVPFQFGNFTFIFPDFVLGDLAVVSLFYLLFIDSLLRLHFSSILAGSCVITFSTSRIEGDDSAKTSAKILKFSFSEQLEMSFRRARNYLVAYHISFLCLVLLELKAQCYRAYVCVRKTCYSCNMS